MTCLRSAPNAKAQQFLHVDYSLETQNKNPGEQPVSAMIAIEAFTLDIVESESEEKLSHITLSPGEMILFTNKCIHRGGANTKKKDAHRVFFYCAHSISDINGRRVQLYEWKKRAKQYKPIYPPEEEETSPARKRKGRKG
jgi:ectoine hydroxylase-related dioxygenase (phytanoyl-CoA dioxygenase family)